MAEVDPEFTAVKQYTPGTLATAKANAAPGQTAEEYLASRGGVNAAGYYGDTWSAKANLTDAEYATALADAKAKGLTGTALGAAINAATRAKQKKSGLSASGYNAAGILTEGGQYDKFGNFIGDDFEESIDGESSGAFVSDGSGIYTASDGTRFSDQQAFVNYETNIIGKKEDRRSAYDLLLSEFKQYGLEALVTPLKSLIEEGISPSEFTLRLRETDAYKKRFAANAQRVAKGLRALSEAEYVGTEDQYQDVMRRYGMPESYYTKGDLGVQSGFEKFLAGDVSAVELEDRIQTAQNRVVNSNPEVSKALKEFYPGISNGDILAYVLDPANAIEQIKRKVTAAEIGGAAIQSGLQANVARAEELGAAGITKAQAQQGFGTIGGGLQRGSQLASIYGEDAYNQTTAEQEVFGLAGAQEARKQRQKITGLERATFGGQTGASSSAISRDRAGAY